ncbi:hypothetical protein M5D96_006582 [Drosophila gunungcola]|uniref:Uncharacterized protein n=1 Tax=Drosophila gunungcola TaxID=103775 RepID=A0A9Q0BR18_9MUSC|nr:hypothetical protein M5D96_006582 [Drosophila gunungcola]
MPSTPYDLVQDDQDLRVPLHAEQAFFHGITFQAKIDELGPQRNGISSSVKSQSMWDGKFMTAFCLAIDFAALPAQLCMQII